MSRDLSSEQHRSNILPGAFQRDLRARTTMQIDLPAFLVCALNARVAEANEGAVPQERSTLNHYIETELFNLVTLRDVAELEAQFSGFADAVHQWIQELHG
jgi:hypothetical protein